MARVGIMIEETLKNDVEIISSVTHETMYSLYDKAVAEFVAKQDPKIKAAIEAAKKARS